MKCALSELTCLSLHRPGAGATAPELAVFYDELAGVHEHLAAEATTHADRELELALAATAHRPVVAGATVLVWCLASVIAYRRRLIGW